MKKRFLKLPLLTHSNCILLNIATYYCFSGVVIDAMNDCRLMITAYYFSLCYSDVVVVIYTGITQRILVGPSSNWQ